MTRTATGPQGPVVRRFFWCVKKRRCKPNMKTAYQHVINAKSPDPAKSMATPRRVAKVVQRRPTEHRKPGISDRTHISSNTLPFMTGGGCWAAFPPVAASPSRILGCAAVRSSDRRVPVEDPWACWACSCRACGDFEACRAGRPGEEYAGRLTLRGSRPGRHRRRRSHCRPRAPARSDTPTEEALARDAGR